MKHDSPTYRERVPASRLWRGGAALILPLLFWWHLTRHIQAVSGRSASFFPSLVFIGGSALLVYGIISLFYGVGIRLLPRRMFDGSRQPVLKIRGVTKGRSRGHSLPRYPGHQEHLLSGGPCWGRSAG